MKVIADLSICIGAGQCVVNAPDFFSQDEDSGLVVAPVDDVPKERLEEIEMAIYACPTRALRLSE
ncbi:MAG: ferredoxin [Sphingobium sp.]|uniref:ferredoxin n=1 Tax=Sphingobium sp. TaxID=1912891 RepID=UPI0029A60C85|nr:ferredoxin [Sphingobium sp.]MDX3909567.1 ferredoxin [Sphingobium sp.]